MDPHPERGGLSIAKKTKTKDTCEVKEALETKKKTCCVVLPVRRWRSSACLGASTYQLRRVSLKRSLKFLLPVAGGCGSACPVAFTRFVSPVPSTHTSASRTGKRGAQPPGAAATVLYSALHSASEGSWPAPQSCTVHRTTG